MWIKIISGVKTDCYSGKLKFVVGEKTEATSWNDAASCGSGIHFTKSLFSALENTNHEKEGFLIEVTPVGKIVEFGNKAKSPAVITKRILTIDEWLETLSENDSNGMNRFFRACKVGLETLSENDSDGGNRRYRACKVGLETLDKNDSDEWNRRLRACKVGLETLDKNDSNGMNRLFRACKVGEWDNIFKCLK